MQTSFSIIAVLVIYLKYKCVQKQFLTKHEYKQQNKQIKTQQTDKLTIFIISFLLVVKEYSFFARMVGKIRFWPMISRRLPPEKLLT